MNTTHNVNTARGVARAALMLRDDAAMLMILRYTALIWRYFYARAIDDMRDMLRSVLDAAATI